MWHPNEDWRTNDCSTTGLMGKWWLAENWGNCAELDFIGMYNYYIIERGYKWCLTTNGTGNKTMGTRLKKICIVIYIAICIAI